MSSEAAFRALAVAVLANCRKRGGSPFHPERIPFALARMFHELLSRDHEDGRATWQPSRGAAGLVPRRT